MHELPLSHMFIKTKWYHPIVTHDQRNQIAVKDIECTLYSLSAISTWMVYQTKSIHTVPRWKFWATMCHVVTLAYAKK
jgi:hypothetical protein